MGRSVAAIIPSRAHILSLGLLLLLSGLFFLFPEHAYARGGGNTVDIASTCDKYQGLINRFGGCIREVVSLTAYIYFIKMYVYFKSALSAFLTFGVIIYGLMLAAGMVENVKRDSFVLLLKIAFIVFFAQNLDDIYFWVIDMMDGLIALYFHYATSFDSGQCMIIGIGYGPFQRLDCMMDLVIGLKTSDYGGSYSQRVEGEGVSRGLIGFFFHAGVSTTVGMVISAIGFVIVYTLVFIVIKVVFMYLMSIIGLSFMVMLGPIFIPLVIFKATKPYFDKWINLIVSFGLQPVIMFAYVALMIIAFDKAIFSGSNSLMGAIVGPEAMSSGVNLNKWLEDNGVIEVQGRGGWQVNADDPMEDTSGIEPADPRGVTSSGVRRDRSGGDSSVKTYSQTVPLNMINWERLAEVRGMEQQELMDKVMLAAVFVGLVTYVFSSMLNHIPNLGTDLSGGIYESPNLWQVMGQNPLSGAAGNIGGSLQQGMQRMLSRGVSG